MENRLGKLLGSSLETLVNQILHSRHVYPRESFCPSSFLGIRCRVNRHPDVVSYIEESVAVAVPSLLSGVASQFSVVICEKDPLGNATRDLESYHLALAVPPVHGSEEADHTNVIKSLERTMRDMILRVLSLESGWASKSASVSFRIVLHIPTEDKSCRSLNKAFTEGKWRVSDGLDDSQPDVWPLYQSSSVFDVDLTLRRRKHVGST